MKSSWQLDFLPVRFHPSNVMRLMNWSQSWPCESLYPSYELCALCLECTVWILPLKCRKIHDMLNAKKNCNENITVGTNTFCYKNSSMSGVYVLSILNELSWGHLPAVVSRSNSRASLMQTYPGVSHFELPQDVLRHVVFSHGVHDKVLVACRALGRPVLMALLLQCAERRCIIISWGWWVWW